MIGSDATLDEIFAGSLEREGGFRGTGRNTIGYTVESILVPASIQERGNRLLVGEFGDHLAPAKDQ